MRPVIVGAVLGLLSVLIFAWLDGGIRPYPQPGDLIDKEAVARLTGAACNGDATCLAKAAPIGAYGEYRRCGGYIESAWAGDSRIACTSAYWTDGWLKGSSEGSSFYRASRRSCRNHDLSYTHRRWTYASSADRDAVRKACDQAFLADSVRDCTLQYPAPTALEFADGEVAEVTPARKEKFDPRAQPWSRRFCRFGGVLAYSAVSSFGRWYFPKDETGPLCDYEPGHHGARDQVVAGRFVKKQDPASPEEIGWGEEQVVTIVDEGGEQGITIELHALKGEGSVAIAEIKALTPAQVPVADRCVANVDPAQPPVCPNLAELGGTSEAWLKLAPVVVDGNGDGLDELLLLALTSTGELVATHVRIDATAVGPPQFATVKAFAKLDPEGDFRAPKSSRRGVTAGEYGQQLLAHNFIVVQRPPEGCVDLASQGEEDVMLIGAQASRDPLSVERHVFRLSYVAEQWTMRRDVFTDDGHHMSACAREQDPLAPNFTSRLQYPSFTFRGGVSCTEGEVTKEVVREGVAIPVRESCPSSTGRASPGYLSDVDLMAYVARPLPPPTAPWTDKDTLMEAASTWWLPLTWNEASDPIMTSRAARKQQVIAVSVFTSAGFDLRPPEEAARQLEVRTLFERLFGEARVARFPFIAVLRDDERNRRSMKESWRQRQSDTVGQPPAQYALLQAKSSKPVDQLPSSQASREGPRQYWSRRDFGDPKMFFELPTILAPFSVNGDPGLSVVMFANCRTYLSAHKEKKSCEEDNVTGLKKDTLQILIVPVVVNAKKGKIDGPRWLECPAPKGADFTSRPLAGDGELSNAFLFREPAVPGTFFNQAFGGGIAIAYRTEGGKVALTTLRKDGKPWWLGKNACTTLSSLGSGVPKRDVWLSKLN